MAVRFLVARFLVDFLAAFLLVFFLAVARFLVERFAFFAAFFFVERFAFFAAFFFVVRFLVERFALAFFAAFFFAAIDVTPVQQIPDVSGAYFSSGIQEGKAARTRKKPVLNRESRISILKTRRQAYIQFFEDGLKRR